MSVQCLQLSIALRADRRPTLGRPDGVDHDVDDAAIIDLTRDGCRIATASPLLPHDRVAIGIARVGRVEARVVWREPAAYGCAFDQPLPPGAVTAALNAPQVAPLGKLSPRLRLATLTGATLASWALVATTGWMASRLLPHLI